MKKIEYIDGLRVIACLAVIVIHIVTPVFRQPGQPLWYQANIYDALVRWTVPIFVMISGTLFLTKNPSYRKIFHDYLPRIICCFCVWSVIYSLLNVVDGKNFRYIVQFLIQGEYHLWFLKLIAGLYLMTPFLHMIATHRCRQIFAICAVIFTFCLPEVRDTFMVFHKELSGQIVNNLLVNVSFPLVGGYTLYYLLGYWLHNHNFNVNSRSLPSNPKRDTFKRRNVTVVFLV